jgi:hypothetical protein
MRAELLKAAIWLGFWVVAFCVATGPLVNLVRQ